jgi:hypothetical protein
LSARSVEHAFKKYSITSVPIVAADLPHAPFVPPADGGTRII